ncbi:MAG: hypothetical protein M3M85_03015 [bacterium]|nr:hypothetical protein [bacterium]
MRINVHECPKKPAQAKEWEVRWFWERRPEVWLLYSMVYYVAVQFCPWCGEDLYPDDNTGKKIILKAHHREFHLAGSDGWRVRFDLGQWWLESSVRTHLVRVEFCPWCETKLSKSTSAPVTCPGFSGNSEDSNCPGDGMRSGDSVFDDDMPSYTPDNFLLS